MGCADRNATGDIYYGEAYTLPVIIHEFNHSSCNPLNEEFWDDIKDKMSLLQSERLILCSASLWRPTHGGKRDVRGGLRDEIPCHTPSAVHTGEHPENQKDLSNAKCIRRGNRGWLLRDTD